MSGLSALLAVDTVSLDAKIEVAGGAGSASLSISITDPLDLLGEAGTLIRSVGEIAEGGADLPALIREAFGALAEIAPFADLTIVAELVETLAALKDRLQPLRDLMDLDPAALIDHALQASGGAGALIDQLVGQVTDTFTAEIPEALAIPMGALRDLAGGVPGDPAQVAGFFARFVLGLDLAALTTPFDLLEAVRVKIAGGVEIDLLAARITAVTLSIDLAAEALVGAAPDMDAILATLVEIRAEIDLLTTTVLPQAIDQLTADIGSVDVAGLAAQLDAALAPLLARVPVPPRGVADFFLPPLRMLGDGIDALTPALIAGILAEIEAEIRAMFAESGVATLRDQIESLLSGVVAFLEGLPLPALRDQLTQALLGIEGKLGAIGDFSPVADIAAKMQEVANAIDGLDTSAVTDRIEALAGELRQFTQGFPIEEIKDTLGGLIVGASDAVKDLPPLIEDLKKQIEALAHELTSIDLSAAGDASAGVVHELRTNVNEALDSADLPAALKVPLGVIAGEVREIDLTASLDAPLADLVAKVDITAALAPVQGAIDQARAALQKLSPKALAAQLDAPFDEVLAKIEAMGPAALIAKLSEGFQAAAGELDKLDPVALVQPLQDEFDAILAKARAAADPSPLLAPLATVYAELQSFLDEIDPVKLLANLVGEVSKLPGTLAESASTALTAKLDPTAAMPGAGDGGPIRFGDMVRPFAALVNEARTVVRGGAEDALAEGLALIGKPLALLAHAGQVAGGHVSEIATAIEKRRALVDPTAPGGPMAELRYALDRLMRVEAGLAAAGRGSVALSGAVGSVQIDVFVMVSVDKRESLGAASAGLTGGLKTDELCRSLHALGNVLSGFVPPALALPDTEATVLAKIDALFDVIDPTAVADEMDAIGIAIQAKFQSFASEIVKGLFKIWNAIFEEIMPVLPQGLLTVMEQVFDAIRTQLAALDPATLEAELDELLDAVVASLQAYSPAAFAGTLSSSFNALKAKIGELDPAVLLGDLDPLAAVIDELKALKPSLVLAPLTADAEKIDKALVDLLDFNPAAIVIEAVANLKLQIELVLEKIEGELDGLLGDLEGAGGGSGAITVSASASFG
ncbi:MAG: hypothetical protein V4574_10485 [Pseudomonadota bacterium]